MLTVPFIRENKDLVITRLRIKNFDATAIVEKILDVDNERRRLQAFSDNLQSDLNNRSREIGNLVKSGNHSEANKLKKEMT